MSKTKKKDLFGQFAVCRGLGTRQSDNSAILQHEFAVCRGLGTRRTVHCLLCTWLSAHDKVTIWPAMKNEFVVCRAKAHGELYIVCHALDIGTRQSNNLDCPGNVFAVCHGCDTRRIHLQLGPMLKCLPCGLPSGPRQSRKFRRVRICRRRVFWGHVETPKSSSVGWLPRISRTRQQTSSTQIRALLVLMCVIFPL